MDESNWIQGDGQPAVGSGSQELKLRITNDGIVENGFRRGQSVIWTTRYQFPGIKDKFAPGNSDDRFHLALSFDPSRKDGTVYVTVRSRELLSAIRRQQRRENSPPSPLSAAAGRFSLRTLLVVVTALGCWLGWQANLVHQRSAARRRIEARGGRFSDVWHSPAQSKATGRGTMPVFRA